MDPVICPRSDPASPGGPLLVRCRAHTALRVPVVLNLRRRSNRQIAAREPVHEVQRHGYPRAQAAGRHDFSGIDPPRPGLAPSPTRAERLSTSSQCVVQARPASNPSSPRMKAPVQTDDTTGTSIVAARMRSRRMESPITLSIAIAPGTTRTSSPSASSMRVGERVGGRRRPRPAPGSPRR
jgi:hypothetical protein